MKPYALGFFLLFPMALGGCGVQPAMTEINEAGLPKTFVNSLGMKLVRIPSGTFTMGEEGLEKYNTEGKTASLPLHEVELSCFYLADKETTKAQFREYVKAKGFPWTKYPQVDPDAKLPPQKPGQVLDSRTLSPAQLCLLKFPADDYPVTDVSWQEAGNFCAWLSEKEGLVYRLPTEAEWEYACRAGTRTVYWWGDQFDPKMARVGGYVEFRGWHSPFAPVGSYSPNPWGLYDMHGNVSEWVADYADWDYYKHSPRKDPKGPAYGKYRITRGGGGHSLVDDPQPHAGARNSVSGDAMNWIGFRIACEAASVAKSLPKAKTPASAPVKP